MRHERIFALILTASLLAPAARADDRLDLARKLVGYTGGVSLILRNFEGSMAASVKAPDIFEQAFAQALKDDQPIIAANDQKLAQAYALLYPAEQLAAEVAFYESPEAQAIMAQSKDMFGVVIWPDPDSAGLTPAQSAAITKFHAIVKQRAAIAAKDPAITDAIMAAETDALVKIRADAFANYCNVRDCKAEGVTLPPQ
jgi:hypothetical protein